MSLLSAGTTTTEDTMAATLSPSTYSLPLAVLELALRALTPGSVAFNLLAEQIDAEIEHRAEVAAEDGYVRTLENRGTYAGSREEADDKAREYWGIGFPLA
jgi:hypothetical protein